MALVLVLGAGPVGGALASLLAWRRVCTRVVLADEGSPSIAAGKALDIRQSCPIAASDTRVTGSGSPAESDLKAATVVVVADHGANGAEWQGESALAALSRIVAYVQGAIVFAGTQQDWLLERTVIELARPRHSAIGSAPLALEAAVRSIAALEADRSVSDVSLTVTGKPPRRALVKWGEATVAGQIAVERLDAAAMRRIDARLPALWPPGPYALASAAALVVRTLLDGVDRTLTVTTMTGSERESAIGARRFGPAGIRSDPM